MKKLFLAPLKRFVSETRASMSVEAIIILPVLFWAYAAMFTYFEAFRAQAVAEKSAYTISDMISRETDPITPDYMNNTRAMFKDLSGLTNSETAIRISLLRWDESRNRFYIDWSKKRGDTPRLRNADVSAWQDRLPSLLDNEKIILVETASDYAPTFDVGLSERVIETFIYTRPRFSPQIVWSSSN